MTLRRLTPIIVLLLALAGAFLFWPRPIGKLTRRPAENVAPTPSVPRPSQPPAPLTAPATPPPRRTADLSSRPPAATPFNPADFPIAAALNAPGATIARDLDILQQVFDAWRTNFPREGNPVGENAAITAALTGDNRLGLALAPKMHPAINARGELCDRWGTPFRFHQLSGERMEIRSAGPDRKFATDDDTTLTPP